RNPVRTLGPEMEDRNLSVRVGVEPVLIGALINYSDEVVKPLALGVLGNAPDKEVRVVNVHSDALVFLGAAHLDPPTLDGELLDPRISGVAERLSCQRSVVEYVYFVLVGFFDAEAGASFL